MTRAARPWKSQPSRSVASDMSAKRVVQVALAGTRAAPVVYAGDGNDRVDVDDNEARDVTVYGDDGSTRSTSAAASGARRCSTAAAATTT
jgi:hypothetical protein